MKRLKFLINIICVFLACTTSQSKAFWEFPRPTGEFGVGTIEGYVEEKGQLPYQVWYPAHSKAEKASAIYSKESLNIMKNIMKKKLENNDDPELNNDDLLNKINKILALNDIYTYAIPNPDIAIGTQKYPIIIFALDQGKVRSSYTCLCEELASHGYVVITIEPHYKKNVILREGESQLSPTDESNVWVNEYLQDINLILPNVLQTKRLESIKKQCDLERIGIIGHLLGGSVAREFCRTNSQCKAGICLEDPLLKENALDTLDKPFMVMCSRSGTFGENNPTIDNFCSIMEKDIYCIYLNGAQRNIFGDEVVLTDLIKSSIKKYINDSLDVGSAYPQMVEAMKQSMCVFFDAYLKGKPFHAPKFCFRVDDDKRKLTYYIPSHGFFSRLSEW